MLTKVSVLYIPILPTISYRNVGEIKYAERNLSTDGAAGSRFDSHSNGRKPLSMLAVSGSPTCSDLRTKASGVNSGFFNLFRIHPRWAEASGSANAIEWEKKWSGDTASIS